MITSDVLALGMTRKEMPGRILQRCYQKDLIVIGKLDREREREIQAK